MVINPNDTQELTFYNDPVGGVEIIKVDEVDKTERLANATLKSAGWMTPWWIL